MTRLTLSLAAALIALPALSPALAQGDATCQELAAHLKERQSIIKRINDWGKKKVDPRQACSAFRSLVSNGDKVVKFLDANQAWCQIPDTFAQSVREDNQRAEKMRAEACKVAAQVTQMEKQARQGAQGGGMLGGPGLTGEYRVPQGAL